MVIARLAAAANAVVDPLTIAVAATQNYSPGLQALAIATLGASVQNGM